MCQASAGTLWHVISSVPHNNPARWEFHSLYTDKEAGLREVRASKVTQVIKRLILDPTQAHLDTEPTWAFTPHPY